MQGILRLLALTAVITDICTHVIASNVVILTKNNMTEFRYRHPLFLLLFSVDWCTHCINMWPEYELAATELAKHKPPIPLAKVDGMAEEDLVKEFNVHSYPTLFIMTGELVHPYRGPYRAKAFIDLMKKQSTPGYVVVNSMEDLALKRKMDDTIVLALYKSEDDPGAFKFFRATHVISPTAKSMASKSDEVRQAFEAGNADFKAVLLSPLRFAGTAQPQVIDVTNLYVNESIGILELSRKLAHKQLPLVGVYSDATEALYRMNQNRLICAIPYSFSLYKESNNALRKLAMDLSNEVIQQFGDKIHWVIVDDLTHSDYLSKYMDPMATEEMIAGCRMGDHKYQMYGEKLSMVELRIFAARILIKIELDKPNMKFEEEA